MGFQVIVENVVDAFLGHSLELAGQTIHVILIGVNNIHWLSIKYQWSINILSIIAWLIVNFRSFNETL